MIELSIIIPTLNEAATIEKLIVNLASQQDTPEFEIIVVDGGSEDATLKQLHALASLGKGYFHVLSSPRGRACQMNAGVAHAKGQYLLFLHADTVVTDARLLCHAYQDMTMAYQSRGDDRVAGHFGLHFIREGSGYEQAYYYYECKTRLNRPGCINGDQGMWMSRRFFEALGGFDESLAYMEDARLAAKVFEHGEWITLSGAVFSSARRFEREGMKQRQTLNALLCNFDAIGMHDYFDEAHQAYTEQTQTHYLDLRPFFVLAHKVSWRKGLSLGGRWWWRTGGYVAANAWQLAFALDCKKSFEQSLPVSDVESPRLKRYDRFLKPIVESVLGQMIAMLATLVWFYWLLLFRRG